MFSELSPRLQKTLLYIADFYRKNNYAPSFRNIQNAVGVGSVSTVSSDVHILIEKEYLLMEPGRKRSLRLNEERSAEYLTLSSPETGRASDSRDDILDIPVFGDVAAGLPIYADEHMEQTIPLPAEFFRIGSQYFVLHVSGESMIEAGIFDGDYVIIKRQDYAHNGDQVVALLGEDATVKTYYERDGYVELHPENSSMEPIRVRHCTILGIVAGLYRIY